MLEKLPLIGRLFRRKDYGVPASTGSARWWPLIREPVAGAWQRNMEIDWTRAGTHHADFSCKTLIARDIAKLPLKLMQRDANDIWNEVSNPSFSPVLRKPNHYQTRNQFWEHWILSKLGRGNTYVLKARDARRVVTALYVLDPARVTPKVADDGSVFYQLSSVTGLEGFASDITVPATEIIHDRMNCLFHPLIGVPPIYAAALAATQGLNIQVQSVRLFANDATPGGILSAPGITKDDAETLKTDWETKFTGPNKGRIAVVANELKFQSLAQTAEDAQLVEQLKLSAEIICTAYHVPAFMIGAGPEPATGSAQERTLRYYTQCLQSLIEDAESCLDEGIGLGEQYGLGVEFDVDNLLRMDTASQAEATTKLVAGSILTPNEGRKRFNAKPLAGGNTVYMQQQNYSLEALAKRDAQADPFASKAPAAAPQSPPPESDGGDTAEQAGKAAAMMRKSLGLAA